MPMAGVTGKVRTMDDQSYMKEKRVLPLVVTMSLPMVISMLVNSLYNIVDSYFVAQVSESAMTALSLAFPLQNMISATGVGFGVGINAAVSYFLGAKMREQADRSATLGLLLAAAHGFVLFGAGAAVSEVFLRAFTDNEQTIAYGREYLVIVLSFAPVQTIAIALEKIYQAAGRMKTTMVCMAAGCVLNIILDPLFISGAGPIPAMGVRGAALATGLGQSLSFACYIVTLPFVRLPVRFRPGRATSEKICRRLYLVGIPATLNLALPSFLVTALNAVLAAFSETYILILGVYYKLQTFIYFTVSGIIQGIRPLVGYNLGAGRPDRVREIFRVALLFGLVIMAIGTVLCLAIPSVLMGLFTRLPATIGEGAVALRIISAGFIVSALSVTIGGTYEGLGKGLPSLVISVIRYIVIIPVAALLSLPLQAAGVWHAFWVTELVAAVVSALMFRRYMRGILPPEKRSPARRAAE